MNACFKCPDSGEDFDVCKVLYSNVDSFLNKKDEFLIRIADLKPSIIALSEIKPKNASTFCESEYAITNYDMFLNKDHKRGVAIYVDKSLKAREYEELYVCGFEECVWCTFDDVNGEKVLLGCIYRSPNTSTDENDDKLFQMLKSHDVSHFNKVCIVGDFNYPDVSWEGEWRGEKNNEIKDNLLEAFLIQKLKKLTRSRLGQKPTLDDWILINDDDMIGEIKYLDPLGKSDHIMLYFSLYISRYKTDKHERYFYDLNKGDYASLRKIIQDVDWSVLSQFHVEDVWCYIKKKCARRDEKMHS